MERINLRENLENNGKLIRGLHVAIALPSKWREEWLEIKSIMSKKYEKMESEKQDLSKEPHITLYYWSKTTLNELLLIDQFIHKNLDILKGATITLGKGSIITGMPPAALVANVECSEQIYDFQFRMDNEVPYKYNIYRFSPHLTIRELPGIYKPELLYEDVECLTQLIKKSKILNKPTEIEEIYLKNKDID
jgi:hypothetical protein